MALPVTDDEVLDWWEMLDGGMSALEISRKVGRSYSTVRFKLQDLGVLEKRAPGENVNRYANGRRTPEEMALELELDEDLVRRAKKERWAPGQLRPDEKAIAEALARIDPDVFQGKLPANNSKSMVHRVPDGRRKVHEPMSGRQRAQHRLPPTLVKAVRFDLARAGLLTGVRAKREGRTFS